MAGWGLTSHGVSEGPKIVAFQRKMLSSLIGAALAPCVVGRGARHAWHGAGKRLAKQRIAAARGKEASTRENHVRLPGRGGTSGASFCISRRSLMSLNVAAL